MGKGKRRENKEKRNERRGKATKERRRGGVQKCLFRAGRR